MNREVPSWMLEPMGYSGLFQRWAVPVASAIAWFYDGDGGEFEYWPDGLHRPSRSERPPFRNAALMADNEYTYHRVGPTGRSEHHVPDDAIPFDAELVWVDDSRWEVHDGGDVLARYDERDVRVSVLWKAYCFRSHAEAEAFDERSDDLAPGQVAEIFADDLRSRGIDARPPTDPFHDVAWRETLLAAYPASSAPAAGSPDDE
jgi:hypothetical protein